MEITVKEIFGILKKGIVFILVTAIAASLVAFCVSNFFIKKSYTSTVKLYVETKDDANTTNNHNYYNNLNYAVALVNTYKEMLQTNKFYAQLSENLNNEYSSAQLSKMISFSALNGTEVFQATVVAETPVAAKTVAESVAVVAPKMINDIKETATLKIIDDATLPIEPSAPNVKSISVMAFLAALVIAAAIVILRKVFDVKISYNDDMTEIDGVPILAAIPQFEFITKWKKNNQGDIQ